MVKVGKFQKHDLAWAAPPTAIPYGANSPNRQLWFGPINKNTAGGATMTFNVRGATWGNITWVDYAEFHSRPHAGTSALSSAGTVIVIVNHNPTLWLPASISVNQSRCFLYIIGRDDRRF